MKNILVLFQTIDILRAKVAKYQNIVNNKEKSRRLDKTFNQQDDQFQRMDRYNFSERYQADNQGPQRPRYYYNQHQNTYRQFEKTYRN